MASTTAAHCSRCGHNNNPQYKFCGMCGTALHGGTPPAPKSTQPKAAPRSVGGYSILGLSQEPMRSATAEADVPQNSAGHEDARQFNSNHLNLPRADSRSADSQPADPQQNDLLNRNLDYLFEEDEKKSPPHWRMYVALALLVITAATLVWQWRRNGYPWDNLAPPTTGQNMGTTPAGAQAAKSSCSCRT
jgi:hypothetical protein